MKTLFYSIHDYNQWCQWVIYKVFVSHIQILEYLIGLLKVYLKSRVLRGSGSLVVTAGHLSVSASRTSVRPQSDLSQTSVRPQDSWEDDRQGCSVVTKRGHYPGSSIHINWTLQSYTDDKSETSKKEKIVESEFRSNNAVSLYHWVRKSDILMIKLSRMAFK